MNGKLSICIPTYNRCSFLRETLDAIQQQNPSEAVDVVVSDNTSTDGTCEMIKQYQHTYKNIKYYRWPKNVGPDLNFMKAVELATSEYCWLMSSDDLPTEGSIQKIRARIAADNHETSVYYANRIECNIRMRPYRTTRWLTNVDGDKIYDFQRRSEILEYFRAGRGIGSLFSYLSTLIFRRDDWNRIPFRPQWNGTIYAHAFKIWAMLKAGGKLTYLYAPLVYNRNGNDTFMAEGALRRFRFDLDGYVLMANETFADDPELRQAFLGVARKSIWELAVKMRILAHNAPAWSEINPRLIECGFSRWQINLWTGLAFAHVLTAIPFNILHRIRLQQGVDC